VITGTILCHYPICATDITQVRGSKGDTITIVSGTVFGKICFMNILVEGEIYNAVLGVRGVLLSEYLKRMHGASHRPMTYPPPPAYWYC
jgi:hypothetical protein